MAKNSKNKSQGRMNDFEQNEDYGGEQQASRGGRQGQLSTQRQARGGQQQGQQAQGEGQQQGGIQNEILNAVQPAFQEVRTFVEASPIRAAAVGAVAGGLLMTLFSTEKGRAFVRMAYDYANPMVAKYAREYISQAAGDFAENAVSQH